MPSSGLFVTLYDEETLNLYLDRGIYGFLMPPVRDEVPIRSRHYHALGDYACAREGTHVFFFLKRTIAYGGQVIGSKDIGSFHLNGPYSPMGRKTNAPIAWNESERKRYRPTDEPGIFEVPEVGKRCQPYLIRFEDKIGLKGSAIISDDLYFELGGYNYPLPSNSIAGMSFCTLTPRETDLAIRLIQEEPAKHYPAESEEDIEMRASPIAFDPKHDVTSLKDALTYWQFLNEAHMEASILANPDLLPEHLRPGSATICRQVPISPFKPAQMDRADICYYQEDAFEDGSIPNVIIELKMDRAGTPAIRQVERYLRWLHKALGPTATNVMVHLIAPSFAKTTRSIPEKYRGQIRLFGIDDWRNEMR